ncbi:hypothetical protein RCL_jg4837.t1 [Rhizophagus clarus]|uniref:Uncharacterized protein n=1 Tax=Rhizophagus clarus TaxID=94130 RepID=A0A8H3MGG8_9GLOM|nr:hypothetical protein RCL_jg4837.t1 [Rhizophagus clarus]
MNFSEKVFLRIRFDVPYIEVKGLSLRYYGLTVNRIDNEREQVNVALVKSFIQADIPLEKVDKLKKFFPEILVNGDTIANFSRNICQLN